MDVIQILKDSYHVMIKDMIEFKRNRFEVAGLSCISFDFLITFWLHFPKW